ncbi:hypothetical protein CH267_12670 [Rhodococcus sp. 06-621-2]|nr:hypothetical protein [Rhodococcus sp. 06-621-2]OZC55437.1 hypothetical protein CH267_12670 [Rhodococcus sp. 06-621-2]
MTKSVGKTTTRKSTAAGRAQTPAIVTHTTAIVTGPQTASITITAAGTEDAQMVVAFGHLMMTFRSAEAVSGVIAGFATVRSSLVGTDGHAPYPRQPGAEFGAPAISIVWLRGPEHTVVPGSRYLADQRRTVRWVDLYMGPITWRITDRSGYDTLMEEFRRVHRSAVGVFLDGGQFRRDPSKILDAFDGA